GILSFQQLVGSVLYPTCDIRVSRTSVGGVVFKTSVLGRIVRRCNDDTISQVLLATAVVHDNGARNDGGRGHAIISLKDAHDVVGRKHFQRGPLSRTGKSVGILAEVERTVSAFHATEVTDCLSNRQDMSLGECAAQR